MNLSDIGAKFGYFMSLLDKYMYLTDFTIENLSLSIFKYPKDHVIITSHDLFLIIILMYLQYDLLLLALLCLKF